MTETNFKDQEEKFKLKILTWNINGIRSFDDFQDVLQNTDADIICIQETKVIVYFEDSLLLKANIYR